MRGQPTGRMENLRWLAGAAWLADLVERTARLVTGAFVVRRIGSQVCTSDSMRARD